MFDALRSDDYEHGVSLDLLTVGRRERGSPASMRCTSQRMFQTWMTRSAGWVDGLHD